MLQHPLFNRSERLPVFLRYIVNESLSQGGEGSAKERTLGIEVFGRKPDHDNNSDPIVRVTASELRKKLAQYYYEDGHNDEIRIELPPGAYLPKFRRSLAGDIAATDHAETLKLQIPATVAPVHQATIDSLNSEHNARASSPPRSIPLRWVAWGVCLLLIVIAVSFAQRMWRQSRSLEGSGQRSCKTPTASSSSCPLSAATISMWRIADFATYLLNLLFPLKTRIWPCA
jgi:hypothetical protein